MIIGLLFSFFAFLGWGIGDFLIQKSTRKINAIRTLFYISSSSSMILLPFIYKNIFLLTYENIFLLFITSIVLFVYAIILFNAFRVGKLGIVEPIISFELLVTILLSVFIGGEILKGKLLLPVFMIILGIFLTSGGKINIIKHKYILEKGSLLAITAAILSGLSNFLIGSNAGKIDPILTIWFTHLILGISCFFIMFFKNEIYEIKHDLKTHPYLIIASSFFDNLAWVSYAVAATLIPIYLVVTISESYIILAILLGYLLNKEKMKQHQKIGMFIVIPAMLYLCYITSL